MNAAGEARPVGPGRTSAARRVWWWGWRIALAGLVLLCLLVAHTAWFKPLRINWFFERVFIEYALGDPETLSSLGIVPDWLGGHSGRLTDRSIARALELQDKLERDLETLRRYDRGRLSGQKALSYDILEHFLQTQSQGRAFLFHGHPVNQLFGVQNGLPTFMATQHRIERGRDVERYIARLEQFPIVFAQVEQGLRHRAQQGIVPQRFVIDHVIGEMEAFVATPATENILFTSLAERMDALPQGRLDPVEREHLLDRVEQAIEQDVYPAYRRLVAHFTGLRRQVRDNDGVWSMPDGEAYYAWLVRMHTTTDMTPEQVHELGLAEVARIEAEMDAILRGQGLASGTIGARVDRISRRPDQLYPDTDEGRAQILADFQAIIGEIDEGLEDWFDIRPTAPVRVERVPEFREATAPGAYYQPPALDGSRPGVFYMNLRDVAEIPRFSMRTLAYHEATPGHHFQIALQQELRGVPTFRRVLPFTAYAEGWALYAERVAWEAGFLADPLDDLGRLQAEMFRAVRLVVDTGLHDQRWTRERAIAYMREKTGMPQGDVVAEIERYLVMPGQALAYKVGMEHILMLRERARQALGEDFDIRGFHNVVLTGGSMPLTVLEARIDAWIQDELGAGD